MSDLTPNLRQLAILSRANGHLEFRMAAMRMFEQLDMPAAGLAVSLMEVERYLTPEELFDRTENQL